MVKVFITYRLKPGVTREEYRAWSLEHDQPIAGGSPGVLGYRIWEVNGAHEGEAPWDVVEEIEVESWEAWLRVPQQDVMKPVLERFLELVDVSTMTMVHATEVA